MVVMRKAKPTSAATYPKRKAAARLPPFTPKRAQQAQLNKAELKAFDTALSFNVDATGEVPATGQLSLVTQGDGLANRDGVVIQVKSLQIRGLALSTPAASATSATHMYVYIVQDRQANGAAAAITDVLTSSTMATALGNVANQYRFKILKRIVVPMTSTAGVTTAYNNVVATVDEYIQFKKPMEIRYTANGGTIADLASNNIFLLAGSDGQSDDTILFVGTARLRFTG